MLICWQWWRRDEVAWFSISFPFLLPYFPRTAYIAREAKKEWKTYSQPTSWIARFCSHSFFFLFSVLFPIFPHFHYSPLYIRYRHTYTQSKPHEFHLVVPACRWVCMRKRNFINERWEAEIDGWMVNRSNLCFFSGSPFYTRYQARIRLRNLPCLLFSADVTRSVAPLLSPTLSAMLRFG